MSVISGFKKVKNYVKETEGYKLLSRWTSSDTVDVNGETLTDVINGFGTASKKDVASSGNASTSQVVMGNDTRLSDARNAKDVYDWAKASTKPSYTKSEVGLSNVDNTADKDKSVKYATSAGSANAVTWSGVTGKPISYTPSSHTHDDRYYTESEMNTKLSGKVDLSADGVSKAINQLSTGTSAPTDADYYVSQYAGGGITTTSYHRRPISALWSYIKGKADSVYSVIGHKHTKSEITDFPTSMAANGGNSATVNGHTVNSDVPSGAKFTDTVYTHPTTSGNKHIPSGGSSGQILCWSADGTAAWGDYSTMGAATASATGKAGLVPAPSAGDQNKYLRGDGTWQTASYTLPTASTSTLGGIKIGTGLNISNGTASVKLSSSLSSTDASTALNLTGAKSLQDQITTLNGNLIQSDIATLTGDIGNTVKYYKSGYTVTIFIDTIPSYNFKAWTTYILGVLPIGYRPKLQIHCGDTRVGGYVNAKGKIFVHTNGQIILVFAEAASSLEMLSITFGV